MEDAASKHKHPERELPSSFDATELICRVEDLEGGGHGTMVDLRLLELDPIIITRVLTTSNRPSDTTLRLFLAVAYGKHFASVQLYTLELGLSDDLDKPMSDMEWIELSQQRSTNLEEEDGTSLAFQIGAEDTKITACALVPAPAVTKFEHATKVSEVASGRCAALLFGTNDNRVFSVTLRVALVGEVDGISLEFDCCRVIRNGRIHSLSGEEGGGRLSIRQILPSADMRTDNAIEDVDESIGAHVADHIELFYPTVPRDSTAGKYSGIESISYSRCDRSSYSNPYGKDHQIVLARDSILITYKNGTIVKLPSWAAFLSHGEEYDVANETEGVANGSIVIPYESMYRHPLDEPPREDNHAKNLTKCVSSIAGEENDYWSLLARAIRSSRGEFSFNSWPVDALVIPEQSSTEPTLPIDFNTSKIYHEFTTSSADMLSDDVSDGEDSDEDGSRASTSDDENFGTTGAVVAGTAALVRGAVGVVRWGLGTGDAVGSSPVEDAKEDDFMDAEETFDTTFDGNQESMQPPTDSFVRGKQMHSWQQSASLVFCDHPRQFEKAIVDPTGTRAALIDNLGRIVLYNLDNKQILLILKGIRNAKCHFSELHHGNNRQQKGSRIFLVVHLIQVQRVDVYRLSDGSRVLALAVPSKDNCRLIECQGPPSQGSLLSCFLLDRIAIDDQSHQYFLDKICVDDEVMANVNRKVVEADKSSERELFYLLQLLSDGHDVNFTPQTILATFKMLTLSDVGEGLDALSQCTRVECNSLELQTKAIAHCELVLEKARLKESLQGSGQNKKSTINSLAKKVAYHESVLRAYHVLHQYETRRSGTNEAETDLDHGGAAANHWSSEALNWLATSSTSPARTILYAPAFPQSRKTEDVETLPFTQFALSCRQSGGRILLSKNKKDRLSILTRIFRPLTQDLFVYKVVSTLLGHLGLAADFDIQQQYFGDWICTLQAEEIARNNMNGSWRPVVQWLRDLIVHAYELNQQGSLADSLLDNVLKLTRLSAYVSEMKDLPFAFLLSVICMDAVSSATKQVEKTSYGRISHKDCVEHWEDNLRKLRVLLLVSIRLAGDVNPTSAAEPLTMKTFSKGCSSSVYAWIARDELTLSHDGNVITALESATLSSDEGFYLTSAESDGDECKAVMFRSCQTTRSEMYLYNPSGLDGIIDSRPLLFFFKAYAKYPSRLAMQRSLILARMFAKRPRDLHLLKHTVSALQTAAESTEDSKVFRGAILEVYQSYVRPVCRAMLFGFDEEEVSRDVMSPLLGDTAWVNDFTRVARKILSMIVECSSNEGPGIYSESTSKLWPYACPVLETLTKKYMGVQQSSIEIHYVALFGFEMTQDLAAVRRAVPCLERLFLVRSLHSKMTTKVEQKMDLFRCAVAKCAENTSMQTKLDASLFLFGRVLGVDLALGKTWFATEMLKLGKDAMISNLITTSLDEDLFFSEVKLILCIRIGSSIESLRQMKNYRQVISSLDADAVRWVQDEASKCSRETRDSYAQTSLVATQSLALRLRNICCGIGGDTDDQLQAIGDLVTGLVSAVKKREGENILAV
mmetsp:Transcript_9725/g.22119  ORF Transcript_9725/g.22119 Transcript_9725/m.22119 type:complete len:1549 (+) Transcript_9725:198-4844(+)